MAGTKGLEPATSAVTGVISFYNNLQDTRDRQTPRKLYKTCQTVGWVVGWEFLDKTALNATLHGRDVSSRLYAPTAPWLPCFSGAVLRAVRTLVRDCEDNPAASSTTVRQSRKEN